MSKTPETLAACAVEADIDELLQRPRTLASSLPARAEGICVGVLESVSPSGEARVAVPDFGLRGLLARSLCDLSETEVGHQVALGFEGSDPLRPIVLGLMFRPHAHALTPPRVLKVDGQDVILSAQGSLELRCGEAVIRMEADGRIELRGTYVTSQASATQRIRGGSVQIN